MHSVQSAAKNNCIRILLWQRNDVSGGGTFKPAAISILVLILFSRAQPDDAFSMWQQEPATAFASNHTQPWAMPLSDAARDISTVDQLADKQIAGLVLSSSLRQNASLARRRRRRRKPQQTQDANENILRDIVQPLVQEVQRGQSDAVSTELLKQAVCATAATVKAQLTCRQRNNISEVAGVVFKDRQTSVPTQRWDNIRDLLYTSMDPWTAQELEPYLYDMDYVFPDPDQGQGSSSHLWDPELRLTGTMHCADPEDCRTPFLPELYYVGDEYMGGWALEGFDGPGLRSAIGPNIAPGDNPELYNYTYVPYTQRILFAPTASLFFPYLVSIYAGDIYVAESDPILLAIARAARAGVVLDYYYVNNYYNFYSFLTLGVATSAVFSATARVRGIIGTGLKLRNFNAVLGSLSRDDYNERNRIFLLNSLAFLGASGGGYLFSTPNQRNAFVSQNPDTRIPYYAYDYAGAANPFPLQPAVG